MRRRNWCLLCLVVLGLAGAAAWWNRDSLLAWYCVRRLASAGPEEHAGWLERVLQRQESAHPHLLAQFRRDDPQACGNIRACLKRLIDHAGLQSTAAQTVREQMSAEFCRFSTAGQVNALMLEAEITAAVPAGQSPHLLDPTLRLLGAAAAVEQPEVRRAGLALAVLLLDKRNDEQAVAAVREWVRLGLEDTDPKQRLSAIHLAVRPEVRMLEPVAPLLGDPAAVVRRAAMLAVGPEPNAIRTDELLHCLHDPDEEVRRLCEVALRSRGLRDEHLRRGGQLTDPRPGVRLQVLDGLFEASDLEPAMWLRHLTHDREPAVRVAAIRAAAEKTPGSLTDRLEQMAREDSSETVRQVARFYLSCQRAR